MSKPEIYSTKRCAIVGCTERVAYAFGPVCKKCLAGVKTPPRTELATSRRVFRDESEALLDYLAGTAKGYLDQCSGDGEREALRSLMRDQRLAALKVCGVPFVNGAMLLELVRMGWRPTK